MADATGNTAVPAHGDHDRVAMLSLKADGTPDQNNPEIIGDKEFALDATREQFKQQAVSAVDRQLSGITSDANSSAPVKEDPEIAERQKAHQAAEDKAADAAEKTVDALFTEDPALSTGPAGRTAGDAGGKSDKK